MTSEQAQKEQRCRGTVLSIVGGLYEIYCTEREPHIVPARARGAFRHEGMRPLAGDGVIIAKEREESEWRVEEILPRRCSLIRPAFANLDVLLLTVAAKDPVPDLLYIDKMLAIAHYREIESALIVNKAENDPAGAERLRKVYEEVGYPVFCTEALSGGGIEAVRAFLLQHAAGKTVAFAGPSGVGKSTLLNALFPSLALQTGAISEKIARGKHTTRAVRLYPLEELLGAKAGAQTEGSLSCGFGSAGQAAGAENPKNRNIPASRGFLADTPGFSMLDFAHFDFFAKEDLPLVFPEFAPYLGTCRFKKCTHTKEQGCAVIEAVRRGEIAASRHASFLSLWKDLKDKHAWDR